MSFNSSSNNFPSCDDSPARFDWFSLDEEPFVLRASDRLEFDPLLRDVDFVVSMSAQILVINIEALPKNMPIEPASINA
jgi:hypothetical protein